jgi:hypothetical protein
MRCREILYRPWLDPGRKDVKGVNHSTYARCSGGDLAGNQVRMALAGNVNTQRIRPMQ